MTSDLISNCQLSDSKDCPPYASQPRHEKLAVREAEIGGGIRIQRALPHRERRMIGAWCFFDHFGPLELKTGKELNIGPHPHIGLQTFSWLLSGEMLHRDSLGSEQIVRPGEINLMTAGKGISHSEESIATGKMQGVQLWLALPEAERRREPEFAHYTDLPLIDQDGLRMTVLVGDLFNQQAPTKVYSPLFALNLQALKEAATLLPLNPRFEYGLLVLSGQLELEGEGIETGTLLYLGCGRTELALKLSRDTQVFLIGGEPFKEEVLLWWNFVARTQAEMAEATTAWETSNYFGKVKGYPDRRLKAPTLPW